MLQWAGDPIYEISCICYAITRWGPLRLNNLPTIQGILTRNSTLAAICATNDLHTFLTGQPALLNNVGAYATIAKEEQVTVREITAEGQQNGIWWEVPQITKAPKPTADIIESLAATFYFSDPRRDTFFATVARRFYDENLALNLIGDPKDTLDQIGNAWRCREFRWLVARKVVGPAGSVEEGEIAEDGVEIASVTYYTAEVGCHGRSLAVATSRQSEKDALDKASFGAVGALENDPHFMARFCDCCKVLRSRAEERELMAELGVVHIGPLQTFSEWLRQIRQNRLADDFEGLAWEEVIGWDDEALKSRDVGAGTRNKILLKFASISTQSNNAT